ncbi:MAG TPA: hypothetical protein VLZ50_02450 [Terracidiphilus sp.]|nr:hypothetical protein [Terracidiphilus sp.]
MAESIRKMLAGGDRRSIGRAEEVAELVRRYPKKASATTVRSESQRHSR